MSLHLCVKFFCIIILQQFPHKLTSMAKKVLIFEDKKRIGMNLVSSVQLKGVLWVWTVTFTTCESA